MNEITSNKEQKIWDILSTVTDPEVPVLTVLDLGVVRSVILDSDIIYITITPTYTGCPAMDMISAQIKFALITKGFTNVIVKLVLSPAWTTDWMTEAGKQKLKAYGIAPPNKQYRIAADGVECPQCNSTDTRLISEFGSTACKALLQCKNCLEPFDYFKCY